MSQTYNIPVVPTDSMGQVVTANFPNALEALRSKFSGAVEPLNTIPFQWWADTATGFLKMRNAAGNAWIKVAPLAAAGAIQLTSDGWAGSLSATATDWIGHAPRAGTIKRLLLGGSTASTSSGGNEWQPMLKVYPYATPGSPVNLFSGTVGTFTALGGVGGGAEFVASKLLVFTPNQNTQVQDLDRLELVMTKVGSATTITRFRAVVEME